MNNLPKKNSSLQSQIFQQNLKYKYLEINLLTLNLTLKTQEINNFLEETMTGQRMLCLDVLMVFLKGFNKS